MSKNLLTVLATALLLATALPASAGRRDGGAVPILNGGGGSTPCAVVVIQ